MKQIYAILTLIFTATFAIAPFLTAPFSGFRADQLPIPQIDPPIQPEGYAFAIWGLIYGWLVVSALYGSVKRAENAMWDAARKPLIISLAIGTTWLSVANVSAVWATILIFLMAITAIAALLRASANDYWMFKAPVGIYAGWLTAASFVSLGSTAAGYGVLTGAMGWAYIGISGALIVAAGVLMRCNAVPYGLTVIWALVGIIVANCLTLWTVSALAGIGILILLSLMVATRANARSIPS